MIVFRNNPPRQNFPRELDNALLKVDRLVVEAHPQGWRVQQYYDRLMAFLPFSHGVLGVRNFIKKQNVVNVEEYRQA
jgi:hypothetical protein